MEERLKFPIGHFQKPDSFTADQLSEYIDTIQSFPTKLTHAVAYLTDEQLDTPYRPAGWTIRQVVHHCADSHMNSFIRFKLALTEDIPTIKPYYEDRWAELPDTKNPPVKFSLTLLEGLHARWTLLLKALETADLRRSFVHPQTGRAIYLDENIALYAWHCNHHLAHITTLKERKGWT